MKKDPEILIKSEIIKTISTVLSSFKEIEIGYIFGSFVEGEKFEDIDIGLVVSEEFGPYEGMKFAMRVGRELEKNIKPRYEVDVKILNLSPLDFQYQVIKKGEPVFIRDELKRVRYEAEVLSLYLDYEETSEWLDREFLKRI